jgi:hypothetical protein
MSTAEICFQTLPGRVQGNLTPLIFGSCGFELWNLENTVDLYKEVKIQISEFSEFPIESSLKGLFWEFCKTLLIKLPYYIL